MNSESTLRTHGVEPLTRALAMFSALCASLKRKRKQLASSFDDNCRKQRLHQRLSTDPLAHSGHQLQGQILSPRLLATLLHQLDD